MGTARMKQDKETEEERGEYGKKKSGHERKKKSRRPKLYLGPTCPLGEVRPEAVDEFPNKPNLHL